MKYILWFDIHFDNRQRWFQNSRDKGSNGSINSSSKWNVTKFHRKSRNHQWRKWCNNTVCLSHLLCNDRGRISFQNDLIQSIIFFESYIIHRTNRNYGILIDISLSLMLKHFEELKSNERFLVIIIKERYDDKVPLC